MMNFISEQAKNQRRQEIRQQLKNKPRMSESDVEFVLQMDIENAQNGGKNVFENNGLRPESRSSNSYDIIGAHNAINKQLERGALPGSIIANGIVPYKEPEDSLLPELPKDNFGTRSDLYAGMDADPDVKKYTDFFGAASMTTNDMAWNAGKSGHLSLFGTMGPIDYWKHGEQYATDMENISKRLEQENTNIYQSLKKGSEVPGITDAPDRQSANYNFVNREQTLVQEYLENMDPDERDTFVQLNNDILNSWSAKIGDFVDKVADTSMSFIDDDNPQDHYLNDFKMKFEQSNDGRVFDFGIQNDREAVGRYIVDIKEKEYNNNQP